jgi:hypothetical protein
MGWSERETSFAVSRSPRHEVRDRHHHEKRFETMNQGSKSMSAFALGVMLGLYATAQAMAQPPVRSREGAGVVVEGIVREVFRTTRPEGFAYLVQLDVARSELGRGYRGTARLVGPAPGDPLYIRIEQPGLEGRRLSDGDTRMPLPEQQTSIRAFVDPRSQGGWENACPDWYEPIAAGAVARNPSGPAPAPGAPGREAPAPSGSGSILQTLGVNAEQAQVSGRLVFKINDVHPDTAAANAGIERGDAIVGVNGAAITSLEQFAATLKREGPIVKLNVRDGRSGREVPVEVALSQERPTPAGPASTAPAGGGSFRSLGVTVEAATADSLPLVKVARVTPGSPADNAGIKPGDAIVALNGAVIFAPDLLEEGVKKAGQSFTLTVLDSRTGKKNQVKINLGR